MNYIRVDIRTEHEAHDKTYMVRNIPVPVMWYDHLTPIHPLEAADEVEPGGEALEGTQFPVMAVDLSLLGSTVIDGLPPQP